MSADYDPTEKTPLIPGGGDNDNDNDDDEWREVDLSQQKVPEEKKEQWQFPTDTDPNTTNPFEPGASSTPSGGENIPMTTRLPPEQQGASGGTAETSFTAQEPLTLENRAQKEIQGDFRNADWSKIEVRDHTLYNKDGKPVKTIIEIKLRNKEKWYPLFTKSRGDANKTFNESLTPEIQSALGGYQPNQPDAVDAEIAATYAASQDLQKQEEAQRKALQKAETKATEAQRLRREMDAIRGRTKDAEDRIQQLENTHGPLDKDAIKRLKDEKRKLAADHQAKRKQLDTLAKAAQEAKKLQQDINKTILSKGETARRLGQLKGQKDAKQPLEELKQKAAELNEHITEDLRIIEDKNTSPSEREAARERLAVRNEELEMVNEAIGVRERQRPLLERVKEIFKKYGWTLQAVALAVGVVLSALALAGLNGIKVILSFLGEHAWLLILAVVAFFMERLLKKRRT